MSFNKLAFEQPINELEEKIEELRRVGVGKDINIGEEVRRLEIKKKSLIRTVYSRLTPHQVVQIARHPDRPYTMNYIEAIFTDFDELHGDRQTSAGTAIISGIARLKGKPVVVMGHQKGRNTKEKLFRNFGMPQPDGFRKALRLMKLAEKFEMPVFTFIDTPGAYPGVKAEEHNQSEAIARNLFEMSTLKTPIICTVIGEGCSGGALAIGVGDRVLMLQYSYYSVISPEGCASILWKSADRANDAADALNLTATRLKELGLIDEIVPEPRGGAHRNIKTMCNTLKKTLIAELDKLESLSLDKLLERRYQKLISAGEPKH